MQENADFNVDPCDDFYQFTCGGFMKNNELPTDQDKLSQYYFLVFEVSEWIRGKKLRMKFKKSSR